MGKNLAWMAILSLLALGLMPAATAFSSPKMRARIPFSFYLEKQLLPAGEYSFEMTSSGCGAAMGSSVIMRSKDGSVHRFMPILFSGSIDGRYTFELIFQRYGKRHFLNKLNHGAYSATMSSSSLQDELRLFYTENSQPVEGVTIASMPE